MLLFRPLNIREYAMKVTGIQKLTLLDYPGVVACTVFTAGCNFRCPFCHNSMLVLPEQIMMTVSRMMRCSTFCESGEECSTV